MTTQQSVNNILQNLNIPARQVDLYLKLLGLGETGATLLSKATGINRTTLYPLLQKMESNGLVIKNVSARTFQAVHPKQLFEINQRHNLALHKAIPLFNQIMKDVSGPAKVKFYSGTRGILQLLLDEIDNFKKCKDKTLRVIGDSVGFYLYDKEFRKQYQQKRKNLGIQVRFILTVRSKQFNDDFKKMNALAKFLPSSTIFTGRFSAGNDKLTLLGTEEDKNGTMIESRELSDTFIQFFDFMWSALK